MTPDFSNFVERLAIEETDNNERNVAVIWWHSRLDQSITASQLNRKLIAHRLPSQNVSRITKRLGRDRRVTAASGDGFRIRADSERVLFEKYSLFTDCPNQSKVDLPTSSVKRAIILTALRVEYEAVRSGLISLAELKHPRAGSIYEVGYLPNTDWEVLIAEIGCGNETTASECERAVEFF